MKKGKRQTQKGINEGMKTLKEEKKNERGENPFLGAKSDRNEERVRERNDVF